MKSYKSITRLDFLKHSGLIAAGLTFLPHSVLASATKSEESDEVSIRKLAGYQIIVPDHANQVEQEAGEKLQHYLTEMSHKTLVLRKEADYRSGPAFFIGQTRHAKSLEI